MAESRRKFDQDFKEGAVRSPSESPARRHHDRDRGSPISGGAVHRAGRDLSSRRYRGSVAHLAHLPAPFDRNLSGGKAERATRAEPVTCSHVKRANGSFQ